MARTRRRAGSDGVNIYYDLGPEAERELLSEVEAEEIEEEEEVGETDEEVAIVTEELSPRGEYKPLFLKQTTNFSMQAEQLLPRQNKSQI